MSLADIAKAVGTVIFAVNIVAVVAPSAFARGVKAFPRNRWAAWMLIAVDLFWVAWIVSHAYLGRFEPLKPLLYAAAPTTFLLMVFFMDELLAARALGGLLLLVADPMLDAARWQVSNWRYVVIVLAYLWVIAGITLILSPFRFRMVTAPMIRTQGRVRWLGAARACFGAFLVFLGLAVL